MKLLKREDIDTELWDQRISESKIENVFCYSWYLDSVAENWMAIVTNDYRTILPLSFTTKFGIKQMYQAPFTREYDIFGNQFDWLEVIELLKDKFKAMHFRNRHPNVFENEKMRVNQELSLKGDFEAGFNSNARRLIKKSKVRFQIEPFPKPDILIQIFKETKAPQIGSISPGDLSNLRSVMLKSLELNMAELFIAKENEQIVAGSFFLKDKNRITYLNSAATDEAKKAGVMYCLLNFSFHHYKESFDTFDFGGSDVETVARFYKKFGAVDRTYYDYKIDNLPIWFKTLKKMKS
ncbi:GNAT family N-acetyltransferase [Crocinitomix catalasitica]|nr:GNAT family N-acetyltransferase [Crocinitomix catalasitica]